MLERTGCLAMIGALALMLGGCAVASIEQPTWASCFKPPTQTSMVEEVECTRRTQPE